MDSDNPSTVSLSLWGAAFVGPPGSGKTTAVHGIGDVLEKLGRPTIRVNLDPANDILPWTPDVDVRDLIAAEDVAEATELGPNGALTWAMEYIAANMDWLVQACADALVRAACAIDAPGAWCLFDCPGQVELYTHSTVAADMLHALEKQLHMRLMVVHTADATLCTDAERFLAVATAGLSTMIRLELPAVHALTKVDLLAGTGALKYGLRFYTDMLDPRRLLRDLPRFQAPAAMRGLPEPGHWDDDIEDDAPLPAAARRAQPEPAVGPATQAARRKYTALHGALVELLEDFHLVSWQPIAIQDRDTVIALITLMDKALGYAPGALREHQRVTPAQVQEGLPAGLDALAAAGLRPRASNTPSAAPAGLNLLASDTTDAVADRYT